MGNAIIMKKILFLLFIVVLSSCGKYKVGENILGTWEVTDVVFPETNLSPELLGSAKREMLSSVYAFKEGGVFRLKSDLIRNGIEGKWKAMDETNEVYLEYTIDGFDYTSTYKVEFLEENKIIISQPIGKVGDMKATLVKK